ncbi:MAG: hypothetical protein GXO61_01275 [Epsilonproteobacteria bacterium]|nr:hypothetical protein [Campylobacterota bacterium]
MKKWVIISTVIGVALAGILLSSSSSSKEGEVNLSKRNLSSSSSSEVKVVVRNSLPGEVKKIKGVKLGSSYVVESENSIKFIDRDKKVLKEIPLPKKGWVKLFVSPNKKIVAINWIEEYKNEQPLKAKVTLFDEKGDKLWEVEHNLSSLVVDPNGEFILGVTDESNGKAPIEIYTSQGLVKKIPKDSRCWIVAFDEESGNIAILTQEFKYSQYITSVTVYDRNFTPIWKRRGVAVGESCGFELSLKGDKLTLTHYAKGSVTYTIN